MLLSVVMDLLCYYVVENGSLMLLSCGNGSCMLLSVQLDLLSFRCYLLAYIYYFCG